jgi:adenosylcobinamide-phosphate synthase
VRSRALGLLIGYAADRLLGDPRRHHPVAGFGRAAGELERVCFADSRVRGVLFTGALVGVAAAAGLAVERLTRQRPFARTAVVAACTWTVLGGRSLECEAAAVHDLLDSGDLPGARRRLTHLVGRDTSQLDQSEVVRAVVESVAENTADAVVAPLLWGAAAGAPGLLAYRAANTLDAMVGHHTGRYERFGWASARLDDLMNLPASRLTGVLGLMTAPARARESWTAWRRDAPSHPSPNAGIPEAVFAGALGVRLGGVNRYGDQVEQRVRLGHGRAPEPHDIGRAIRLARRVDLGAVGVAAALATSARRPRGTVA